jgi:two-component system, NarL family, nitrate/nitrite response regulator NarL
MSVTRSNEDRVVKIDQSPKLKIRALIVDRDAMSGHLLAEALMRNRSCDTAVILGSDLLRTIGTRETDLVIISADLSANSGSGFELADAVHRARPEIIIVVLLKQIDHESVVNAFRSGARGVFSRQGPMEEFLECIDHVKRGYLWAGREETNFLLEMFKNIPGPPGPTEAILPLTKRELEVVQCAAKGKTNRGIADELGLSEHTVKNYLFRAFDKLGISTRGELLFYLTVRGCNFGATPKPGIAHAATPPAPAGSPTLVRIS